LTTPTTEMSLPAPLRLLTAADHEPADLAAHAADLIEGIAQANAFVDANKRTAPAAALVYVCLNGFELRYQIDAVAATLGEQALALITHATEVEHVAHLPRVHVAALS
jgi:prophage maintenance system killer protein